MKEKQLLCFVRFTKNFSYFLNSSNYFRKLSFKILKLTVKVMYNITAPFFNYLYTLALVSRVSRLDDVHLLSRNGRVVALQGKQYDFYSEPDIRLMNIQVAVRKFFKFFFLRLFYLFP